MKRIKTSKYKKILFLISLILIFSLNFITLSFNINKNTFLDNPNDETTNELQNKGLKTQSFSDEYSGIGTHQNVTEYGQGFFQNNNINLSKSENASIKVPNNWNASKILINVTNIYEYDKMWMNETFDNPIDPNYWSNSTTGDTNYFSAGWYDASGPKSSIYMRFDNRTYWNDTNSYLNYSFELDRDEIKYNDWIIKFKVKFVSNISYEADGWWVPPPGSKIYCEINISTSATQSVSNRFYLAKISSTNYPNNTWKDASIDPFTPEMYDFDPPGNISILFGIDYAAKDYDPMGYLEVYYDNITLEISTIPRPSQIKLNITDKAPSGEKDRPISDIGRQHGLGTTTLGGSWDGAEGGADHEFSFSSNSTGNVIIYSDFFVNATSLSNTTTEVGNPGSEFYVENGTSTIWTMYFPVSIPGTYQTDYYFNVSKPWNWNVTHLIDPYGSDKILNVSETSGIGNTTLIIPNNITVNGRWKIIAESPNYVLNASIWKWETINWEKNTSFEILDLIKINATINNTLNPYISLTNATLLIYYPNGTILSQATQEVPVSSSGNIEFSNFTFGAQNATAGEYTVNIRWKNNESSQIGLFVLNFDVTHNTTLTRASDQKEKVSPIYSGDTVLIKVNYTDSDTGEGILGANINYTIDNETAITGDMVYFGGGIYVDEIDTTNWQSGLYNISVSANKTYYISRYEEKLIKLEITERTNLTSPQIGGLSIPWGKNASIDVSYNGSGNHGIPGATIDCDWDLNYYWIQDLGSGHYKVIINTSIKTFGTYPLKINASLDGYEDQEIYIALNIRKIYTNISYIQPDPVDFNSNVSIQCKYGDIDNERLISSADITISSELGAQYWDSNDFFYYEPSLGTYNIIFNTSLFNAAGTYQIYVTANKTNYSDATTLINIFIEDRSTYVELLLDGENKTLEKSIDLPKGATLNITIKYRDLISGTHVDTALVQLIGEGLTESLTENSTLEQYSIIINTDQLGIGIKFLTIYSQKANYQSNSFVLRINVKKISINVATESGMTTINARPGESVTIDVILYDLDFNQTIKNATVTYAWIFGQGELLASDKDGKYEATITNVPEGTYTITISVYAGDDYEFKSFEITLNVIQPEEATLLFQILTIISIAVAVGVGGYFIAYQRVLKYPKPVRKTHKFKKTLKKKKVLDVEILSRKDALTTLYKEELGPIAKFFKENMKYEQPEKQLKLKLSKDELIDTLSEISPEESEKNEK